MFYLSTYVLVIIHTITEYSSQCTKTNMMTSFNLLTLSSHPFTYLRGKSINSPFMFSKLSGQKFFDLYS